MAKEIDNIVPNLLEEILILRGIILGKNSFGAIFDPLGKRSSLFLEIIAL